MFHLLIVLEISINHIVVILDDRLAATMDVERQSLLVMGRELGGLHIIMLAQSHDGEIALLPALPERWKKGSVYGLRLRGGHCLDMEWSGGKLVKALLSAASDVPVTVRIGEKRFPLALQNGNRYDLLENVK